MRLLLPLVVLTLAACSGNQTRELQGRLATGSTAQQLVVIETAGTTKPQQFVGAADASGRFVVTAPVGVPVRLLVANATPTGFQVTGHLNPSRFTIPVSGPRIDLGNVRPTGSPGVTIVETPGSTGTGTTTPTHLCPNTTTTENNTPADARLPYDVRPALGSTFKLDDAFLAEGPLPASIVSVTMDNGTWRLTELQNDTSFVITSDDCSHPGNRDIGRDRVFITWKNADGSQQTDHLDIRYCDGSGSTDTTSGGPDGDGSGEGGSSSGSDGSDCHPSDDDECGGIEVEGCGETELSCDHDDQLEAAEGSSSDDSCATGNGADGGIVQTGDGGIN